MDIFGSNTKKLGFGLMRLPLLNQNDDTSLDVEQIKKMVDIFMENGFTYFDTAIMYCGFKSQSVLKEVLTDRYDRDKFSVATKLHCGFFNSIEERDAIFEDQLNSTGLSYFDYYLLHDMSDEHYSKYIEFDCFNWLIDKKKKGLVKHIGFSYHDNAKHLDEILSKHPEIEFVQLQLNYLDWDSEAIQSKLCHDVCAKYGKPVIVMEPVRGGTLANVPKKAKDLMMAYNNKDSIASWAIRFAASCSNVRMVLSGMSNIEQMLDNTSYMKDFKPLDDKERSIISDVIDVINESIAIPCTSCSYCVKGCPMNIAIPKYFSLYNVDKQESMGGWRPQKTYFNRLSNDFGKTSDCIGCGSCESICPQHLPIIDLLKEVTTYFENR